MRDINKWLKVCLFSFLIVVLTLGFVLNLNSGVDVALIGAMDCEINALKEELVKEKDFGLNKSNLQNKFKKNQFVIYKGKIGKNKVVIAKSGVGKVNAALLAQYLIDNYNPKLIINTGVAGALNSKLKIGDVVFALDSLQYDFDISYFGYAKGYISNMGENTKPSLFKCKRELSSLFAPFVSENSSYKEGRIASGDKFISDVKFKNEIKNDFSADAVDMESAAIVQAANINNVPCVVIRAISDLADGDKKNNYSKSEVETAKLSAQIVVKALKEVRFGI